MCYFKRRYHQLWWITACLLVFSMLITMSTPAALAQADDADIEAQNKEIVANMIEEVFNQRNVAAAGDYYSMGYVEHTREGDNVYDDSAALEVYLGELIAPFPDLHINIEDMIAEGDRVVTRFLAEVAGGEIVVDGIVISRLEEGKIVEDWEVLDELSLMTQLGMIEMPMEGPMEPEVVAEGFNGPMGVLVAPDGNIWVIDSGVGGETEVPFLNPETSEPETALLGDTTRIVMIAPDGVHTEVATLPSLVVGEEAVGGARLALLDGELYATSGAMVGDAGDEPAPLMSSIVQVIDAEVTEVANTWALEAAENLDGFILESHPYGLAAGPDGNLWVADAGANALLTVDPASGEISVVTVFDGVPSPLPNPNRDGAMESDPVPTGVTFDDEGNAYVSLLPGFPFLPGSAKVVQVAEDGTVSDYATGLTMLTDLRTGPDGEMYAVQIGLFTQEGPQPDSGAIVRVHEGDTSEIVLDGLSFPTSIDFDEEGNAYITINGVGPPGSGAVVMAAGLTEAPGMPLMGEEMVAETEPQRLISVPPVEISAGFPYESKFVEVFGSQMHYVDEGEGDPILFLHGNPTSSYLWRNVMPFVEGRGRVIALDLIGMGQSDKPDIDYTFADHAQYVEGFIDALELENITLVVHDWGSGLGFDYAARYPDNIKGIAFMEAIMAPAMPASSDQMPPDIAQFFSTLRDPEMGPELVINQNFFVEQALPGSVVRDMTEEEMDAYRVPYLEPESRKPVLVWPNQIPIDGEPADVVEVVNNYNEWLFSSDVPKLHIYASPGALNPPEMVDFLAQNLSNYETVYVGQGIHFIQEDHPEAIGRAIADWLRRMDE